MSDSLNCLDAAVEKLSGHPRDGQRKMAQAVEASLNSGRHLLVQAGTGTGKSLAYLAPAMVWACDNDPVVVATATLALQSQLAKKDIPLILSAIEDVTGTKPKVAVLKGRSNYACLMRVNEVVAEQDALIGQPGDSGSTSSLGKQVVELREWANDEIDEGSGEREDAPAHTDLAWKQVSVNSRECIGAQACSFADKCFAERARTKAGEADLVITNHALLAIDAMADNNVLPEHSAVIIDEAHELTDRVTGAASAELTAALIARAAKSCSPWVSDELAEQLTDAAEDFSAAISDCEPGRLTEPGASPVLAADVVRQLMRNVISAMSGGNATQAPEKAQAAAMADEVHEVAKRISELSSHDVVWLTVSDRFGSSINVAPLSVSGLMREKVLDQVTTIMTSATLAVGGKFNSAAGSVGLAKSDEGSVWSSLDVGSPFEYAKQGILYLPSHMPKPSRDGLSEEVLKEIAELVWASGGRALGLFASQRSATAAAEFVRAQLPAMTVLCQGEAQISELTKRFAAEPNTALFGTLSLWQGIDVPGDSCQLVVIEKIPFPRPDDPLMQARKDAVDRAGGNGFMSVAASHAGLLMAQGAGRLIRRQSDRGVVAVLDSRMVTARYGSFLLRSLPPFWRTRDHETVVSALQRLAKSAEI